MAKISEQAQKAAGMPQPGTNVVPIGVGWLVGPPPDMDEAELKATAGAGLSSAASDNIVPTVNIMHYTDGRAEERDPAYVPGARPGDFFLRGAPEGEELIKSSEGFLFQPCYFWNNVIEWIPAKPGANKKEFVARHEVGSAENVPGARQGPKDKYHWVTADGAHDLEERRNFAGYVYFKSGLRLPFLISLKGTGHQVGKAWMAKMNAKMAPNGVKYAIWSVLYHLRTEPRSRDQYKWFMYTIADGRWATKEERAAGMTLHEQFKSGEKQAEVPTDDAGGDGGDTDSTQQGADTNKVDASI